MFFSRIKTPGIAHVAYVIADGGRAAIVDPRRDVDEYLDVLKANDLTLAYVLETHRQEDFELGSAELRRITGAKIVSGDHSLFAHSDIRLKDGEDLEMAGITFKALHTPGHTPESVSYAVYLQSYPGKAWGVFTGDALFIGDAGRTDLPDPDKTADNASLLFDSIRNKILPLGDQAFLLPAHGAGTVCGGNVANRDHATLGLEKTSNPALILDRDEFIRHRVGDRIPRPPYFRLMEEVNLEGGRPLALRPRDVPVLQPGDFKNAAGDGIIIDTRLPEAFAGGHVPGSYSIWLNGLAMFGGWVAGRETRVYLIVDSPDALEQATLFLARQGIDRVAGTLAGGFEAWRDAGLPVEQSGTITARELADARDAYAVLDVREISEFESGHIEGAAHVYVGHLEDRLADLPREFGKASRIAVTCSVGHRASLAVSILKRHGYEDVRNLLGGMTAWQQLDLPTVQGAEQQAA
jgi:hydroxyacylglutathione hydrolase